MSVLHFITGKGGTGKSTLAASLVHALSLRNEGPVLLLEVQGSGRSPEMLGLAHAKFENTAIFGQKDVWGARIMPRETFRQYFDLLLSMGKEKSVWATATSGLREHLVDFVFDNKVVSAFVETCPGLEPAVLLGKLHWEATKGLAPEIERPWAHVVVDAPATGHGVMLFKSAFALTEVFSTGIISKQASEIKSFVQNPQTCKIYLATTPEELPLAETLELAKSFSEINIPIESIFFNRVKNIDEETLQKIPTGLDEDWKREYAFEIEASREEKQLLSEFKSKINSKIGQITIPEIYAANPKDMIPQISPLIGEKL